MANSSTIETLLNHRSIRDFTEQQLSEQQVDQLLDAARQSSSSMFMQQFSIINVSDSDIKKNLVTITGHPYAANNGHLFIFVADQYRNYLIGREKGLDTKLLGETDRLLGGVYDATIAAQSIVTAAESIGLGAVYLGSILNDAAKVVDMLNLPRLTFPLFALAVGYPASSPELKPRLPKSLTTFNDQYKIPDNFDGILDDYDKTLTNYYATRSTNNRSETFREQIDRHILSSPKKRRDLYKVLRSQGFLTEA